MLQRNQYTEKMAVNSDFVWDVLAKCFFFCKYYTHSKLKSHSHQEPKF